MKVNLSTAEYYEGEYFVQFRLYPNKTTALVLYKADDDYVTASVNIEGYSIVLDKSDHIWLKLWGDCAGIVECLLRAGIVELTGNAAPAGFAIAWEARIIGEARELLERTL